YWDWRGLDAPCYRAGRGGNREGTYQPMDMNRFTEKAQEALIGAQERARQAGNPQIEGLHLLAGLLADPDGVAAAILRLVNTNPDDLRRRVDQDIAALQRVSGAADPPRP